MSEVRRQAALMQRPNWGWQDEAACRGRDVVLFFGPDGERQPEREIRERKAKAVCAACPVRAECLTYAVTRPEKYDWPEEARKIAEQLPKALRVLWPQASEESSELTPSCAFPTLDRSSQPPV